jgi:hypothetical protein
MRWDEQEFIYFQDPFTCMGPCYLACGHSPELVSWYDDHGEYPDMVSSF